MKLIYVFIFFLGSLFQQLFAQAKFIWPVADMNSDYHILFRPNDFIGNEYNLSNLIFSGKENSLIVSPVNGKVTFYVYYYSLSLTSQLSFHQPVDVYEKDILKIDNVYKNQRLPIKNINAHLVIETNDGLSIIISGIKPLKPIKSGSVLKQGDTIGTMGYSYFKILKPSIIFSVSKNNEVIDPMLPFGLKSTFIEPNQIQLPDYLTKNEAIEDLNIFINAIEEGYPGVYDYMTFEEWELFKKETFLQVKDSMTFNNFKKIVVCLIHQLKDSHLNIIQNPAVKKPKETQSSIFYFSSVYPGFLNDTLRIVRTLDHTKEYWGYKIKTINGLTPIQFKAQIEKYITGSDGFIQSYPDGQKLMHLWSISENYIREVENDSYRILFENDTFVNFQNVKIDRNKNDVKLKFYPDWRSYLLYDDDLELKKLSNSTAYIRIPNFDINEMQIIEISTFIKNLSDSSCTSLIVDLRNNYGGDVENIIKLYSYFAQQPFKICQYSKVNKTDNFGFFKYCTNYSEEINLKFPDYFSVKGEKGYYKYDYPLNYPDSFSNFKGKLYVLTNEKSFSAAAIFAALVYKQKRGVLIGRETGSAYYQMNAEKFANLSLPNSKLVLTIPLIKIVFDSLSNETIPWGRGVLPHYEIKLSFEELSGETEDPIFNKALQLIKNEE